MKEMPLSEVAHQRGCPSSLRRKPATRKYAASSQNRLCRAFTGFRPAPERRGLIDLPVILLEVLKQKGRPLRCLRSFGGCWGPGHWENPYQEWGGLCAHLLASRWNGRLHLGHVLQTALTPLATRAAVSEWIGYSVHRTVGCAPVDLVRQDG